MTVVLLSVGDASGDAHAADFVRALRELRPETRFVGMGGGELRAAGAEILADQRELAVGGLFELLPSAARIARVWRRMAAALEATRPDLVVLVDASGFNLPFARRAKRAGVPTLYYVAPQVWAWRPGRLRKLARRVDRAALILPFEASLYAEAGVDARFVGHPLVERTARALRSLGGADAARARAREKLGIPAGSRVVALLPASRRNELRHVLPLHLETARVLHARDPRLHFVLPMAPSLDRTEIEARVRAARLPSLLQLDCVPGASLEALCACDVALAKPGTATLEALLLDRPLVVAARGHPLTAALLRRLLRVDWLAMPNLIADARVVPELLQDDARPEAIAEALLALLAGPERERTLRRFAELRRRLGGEGASARAAALAEEMLGARART